MGFNKGFNAKKFFYITFSHKIQDLEKQISLHFWMIQTMLKIMKTEPKSEGPLPFWKILLLFYFEPFPYRPYLRFYFRFYLIFFRDV